MLFKSKLSYFTNLTPPVIPNTQENQENQSNCSNNVINTVNDPPFTTNPNVICESPTRVDEQLEKSVNNALTMV